MAGTSPSERSGGFGIGTYGEDIVESNAMDKLGPKYGDPRDRAEAMSAGLVDARGKITAKGWEQLNEDIGQLERNSMAWLRKTFGSARDEGHSDDELIGTFWYDTTNLKHAEMLLMGVNERIDMSDSSYGDLAETVWKDVSPFGQDVLGGAISFFDIPKEALDEADETAERVRRPMRRAVTRKAVARQKRQPARR
jgi:hypothetical protein